MPPITRLRLWLAALLAGLLAVPAAASAGTFGYLKVKGLSQPRYETEKVELRLPAYDGKQLYLEITKPKQAGRYPVILESSPYHGTIADREGTRILPDPKDAD